MKDHHNSRNCFEFYHLFSSTRNLQTNKQTKTLHYVSRVSKQHLHRIYDNKINSHKWYGANKIIFTFVMYTKMFSSRKDNRKRTQGNLFWYGECIIDFHSVINLFIVRYSNQHSIQRENTHVQYKYIASYACHQTI